MIALITPTGARQAQFNFCCHFMRRQTYQGPVTWIIVDDTDPRTTDAVGADFRPDWTIIKVYPMPPWSGANTQARNLSCGLDALQANYRNEDIEAVMIIEDDDFYRPVYIERMLANLKGYWVAGERNTIYYNVVYRNYADNNNRAHSSLFQTVFTPESIPIFRSCLPAAFIDAHFFMVMDKAKVNLFNEGTLSIGMKGMPGRKGIGAGHTRMMRFPHDMDWRFLKSMIGEEDANLYVPYFNGIIKYPTHDILTHRRI